MELLALTPSLQHYIFSFCDADPLFTVSHVCREWRQYAQQEALWFHLSRLNARRASCCTYHLCRGKLHHETRDAVTSSSPQVGMSDDVESDPYAFMFGETFVNPFAAPTAKVAPAYTSHSYDGQHHQQQQQQQPRVERVDAFRGLRLAEDRVRVPLSFTPQATPSEAAHGDGTDPWWPRMRCPIPPPPWEASADYDSSWTSLARAGDGGHGGVREYTMRFLRYLSFSLTATYPTSLQIRTEEGSTDDDRSSESDDEEGQGRSSQRSHPLRDTPRCYYCHFARLNNARHPRGCQRSRDGIALISPNGYTFCLSPLRDRLHLGHVDCSAASALRTLTVWYTSFLRHFAIAGERGWQQVGAGGGGYRDERARPGQGRGLYVGESGGSWGPDGSEGVVYAKELTLAFRIEWLPASDDTEVPVQRHSDKERGWSTAARNVTSRADAAGDDGGQEGSAGPARDSEAALVGPAECIVGFVDRQDVWRYERAAVDLLAGRQVQGDMDLPTWLNPTAGSWPGAGEAPSSSYSSRPLCTTGGGMTRGLQPADPLVWASHSSAGAGGSDENEVEAEVASWLAAATKDVEARESAASLSTRPANSAARTFQDAPVVGHSTSGWGGDFAQGASSSPPQPSSRLEAMRGGETGAHRAADVVRGPIGGVFVGDTPNGYGFAVRHQSWIHDRHVSGLGLTTASTSMSIGDWGVEGQEEEDGETPRATYVMYRFHTEEDCVQLCVNGVDAGTVLVDAFSEGQVWVPAVSVKGPRCAVTILPPEMVLYER